MREDLEKATIGTLDDAGITKQLLALCCGKDHLFKEEWLPKAASSFGLEGYYWPKVVALPKVGPITISAATPLATVKVT